MPVLRSRPSVTTAQAPVRKAERRQLTLMFCDIVNSIGLSNRLDPEDLRDVIAAYQRACVGAIQHYDGFVAKYIGDGILAFFGYPLAHEDAAENSLRAGLAVLKAMPKLNDTMSQLHGVRLAVRVGIATGLVVVGDIIDGGVAERDAVTGETVNLAARLQAVADANIVVVSAATRKLAAESFEYRDLGMQDLRGFGRPFRIYQVVSEKAVSRLEARGTAFTPFVGRHRELALLCERWERVFSGNGQAVAIIGEAGIGKSRAAVEARSRICVLQRERGLVETAVLTFQCSPRHTNAPLFPVIRRLEEATAIHTFDTHAKRITALEASLARRNSDNSKYFRLLADLLGLNAEVPFPTVPLGPSERRHLTIEALKFWCESYRENRSLIIVFEDVQWIDPTSKLLLSRLVQWAKERTVLIIATMRPDRAPEADLLLQIGWIEPRDRRPSHIALCEMHQLPDAETKSLIAAVAAGRSITAADEEAILNRSEGIPLYVEELTKGLVGAPTQRDIGDFGGEPVSMTLPNTLSDALMARLDALGSSKDIAQQASVIGQEFSFALLSQITSKQPEELCVDIEALIASGLVIRSRFGSQLLRFKHTLFHEIAYESLLKKSRRELHRKIADELLCGRDGQFHGSDGVVAHHYSLGGLPEQSVALWHKAAKEAIARSAHEEALAMLGFALADFKKFAASAAPSLELDLVLAKATALRSISGYSAPAVTEALRRARDLCEASEDIRNQFNVEWVLFQGNLVKGDLRAARTLADELISDSERNPDLPRVDALLADGMAAFHMGHFERAHHSFQLGVGMTCPEHDEPHFFTHGQNPGVFCLSYLAHAQCFLGQLDQARKTIERSVALSEARAHNPAHLYGYVNALTFAVRVHEFCGDVGRGRQRASQIVEISRRNGFKYYEGVSTCHLAWATGISDSLGDGISKMRDGIATLEETGTSLSVSRFCVLLAELYIRAGQREQAQWAIEKASGSESGTHAWDAEIVRVRGDIIAMKPCSDVAEAISTYQASLAIARRQKARLFELKTTVSFARQLKLVGQQTLARELLGNCLQQVREGHDTMPVLSAQTMMQSI